MPITGYLLKRDFLLPSTYSAPPPGYVTPSWPSLYNPSSEGIYLYLPSTIWKFTLYWTLLFEGIVFMGCGLFASFTFWRSGRKGYNHNEGKKNRKTGMKEGSTKRMSLRRSSVGLAEYRDEWIPLNQPGRPSSIITTI